MNKTNKNKNIKHLEELAVEVLRLKSEREQRRPLLIEFCGSPKSGKSTTINSLNIFLKRNGFKTMVLTERASVCPIENKTHPFFNIWTLSTAIAEIVKNLDLGKDKVDIIISDRGIFDSLCWFEWLRMNPSENAPYLDQNSYKVLTDFVLLEMWTDYLDLVYVFTVSPETSITREYANLLTEKRGSIMTESVLTGFNKAIETIVSKHGCKFHTLQRISTDTPDTNDNPNKVGYQVTLSILEYLKQLLVEKIGYIKLNQINPDKILLKDLLSYTLEFGNRDEVEKTDNIQPIPIAVITNPERTKVLVVKKSHKRTSDKSAERDKHLLYIGGHIRVEDRGISENMLKIFQRALHREIQEEIGESISIEDSAPTLIYSRHSKNSEKHLAVCFLIEMDLTEKKFKLTSGEFVKKTETSKSGYITDVDTILKENSYKLEEWSIMILKKFFKKEIPINMNLPLNESNELPLKDFSS